MKRRLLLSLVALLAIMIVGIINPPISQAASQKPRIPVAPPPSTQCQSTDLPRNLYEAYLKALPADMRACSYEQAKSLQNPPASGIRPQAATGQDTTFQPADTTGYSSLGSFTQVDGVSAIVAASGNNNGVGAAYIFTYDPGTLWTQEAILVPSDAIAGDYAGNRQGVSMNGDTAVVGVSAKAGGLGAVYVFTRSGTTWTQQQKISAPAGVTLFGRAVSMDGHTLAIGGINSTSRGIVYVYKRTAGVFSLQASFLASDNAVNDGFGSSVSLRSNRLAVGAVGSQNYQGAAYIFDRVGTTWTETAKLVAGDPAAYDYFGGSVTLEGNNVAVSATNKLNVAYGAGAVYTFSFDGSSWSQGQKLLGDANNYANFGYSIAISGTRLAVIQGYSPAKVVVYELSGGVWSSVYSNVSYVYYPTVGLTGDLMLLGTPGASLYAGGIAVYSYNPQTLSWGFYGAYTGTGTTSGSRFASTSAVDGNTAVFGAWGHDFGNGAAYVYTKTGSTWSLEQKISPPVSDQYIYFGTALALKSDTLVIGAIGYLNKGAVFVYTRSGGVWTLDQTLTGSDVANYDAFGSSVALDLGTSTIAVGASRQASYQGAAYTFEKVGGVWTETQKLTASDGAADWGFGGFYQGVALSGNTLLIGASAADGYTGAGYIFKKNTTWVQYTKLVPAGASAYASYGYQVALQGETAYLSSTSSNTPQIGNVAWWVRNSGFWIEQPLISYGDSADHRGVNGLAVDGAHLVAARPGYGEWRGVFSFVNTTGAWTGQGKFVNNGAGTNFDGFSQIGLSGSTITTGQEYTGNTRGIGYIFNFTQPGARNDTIGIYRPSNNTFYLKNTNQTGFADVAFNYGGAASYPIVGDWDGDGIDSIGIYDQNTGVFALRNSNSAGVPDIFFTLGDPGDQPIAGRWSVDMTTDGAGVFRPTNGVLYLKKTLTTGFADFFAVMGNPGDVGVAGDWDGNGLDSIGIYRPTESAFYLSNNSAPSGITFSDVFAVLGNPNDTPVIGDWSGIGKSGVGVYRPTDGRVYLKNVVSSGFADNYLVFGNPGDMPVAGRWILPSAPPLVSPLQGIVVRGGQGNPYTNEGVNSGAE